ncbi:uncharacterized protein LOC115272471 [Suricata suricatta]|uniref:uncharacterized protein LOC115272471 n=1 Tax=Suricata suricatta TaxID=37032 RepID=UPI0011566DA9|nr:uncharacterized protein LOC115272471 [Suricata suricatta]
MLKRAKEAGESDQRTGTATVGWDSAGAPGTALSQHGRRGASAGCSRPAPESPAALRWVPPPKYPSPGLPLMARRRPARSQRLHSIPDAGGDREQTWEAAALWAGYPLEEAGNGPRHRGRDLVPVIEARGVTSTGDPWAPIPATSSPTSPSLGSLVPEGSRSQEPGKMHCANILTLFVSVREPHRHIQVKRSLNKSRQPSQCKNKYPSSGRSSTCAAPKVPSAAPNNYKSVQRECVGVSVNGCVRWGARWSGVQNRSCEPSDKGVEWLSGKPWRPGVNSARARLPHTLNSRVRTGKS